MVSIDAFRKIALGFPEATEQPHFEKTSFRFRKKIFATLSMDTHIACLKLSEADQSVYRILDPSMIYPVNNKWGKQGWTFIHLDRIKKPLLQELLVLSYGQVAQKSK